MDDLVNSLQDIGFKAKVRKGKVLVTLDGLSNPVSIVKDIAADEYKVKTNDSIQAIMAFILLFFGLFGVLADNDLKFTNAALISIAMFSFITVLLTEFKVNNLRSAIAEINRGRCA
ncbi:MULTISPECIES: hypothetical protein [unclassified Shewanella]|uniref:hypothetical protein n=1 Tax=unclassified Shewanella TaxID=196818 RepID=UPI000C8434CA|nr:MULTISPECIES: hypothetical protein [unclassified Shewanella]MDO6620702.1 hypothetical protein [Shewanella sp. 6_MG-2023]MDO6640484.1 hypothetical protein [Shewanella sp. 5_MG-2023]MDO6678864.1 hypothetical protein [Shewanella sp. 4_MG-2023]PMG28545.1 hypothetical protein BCU94_17845 [Shewanella sp. 10N.286.52.C2]PMG49990.1 hypothetical protein BCU91_17895 [Shewanella sp. 10N.286.52.B9]